MGIFTKLANFIKRYFFNSKWTCNVCGKEIFDGKYFCDECESLLPFNDGAICDHCGRKVISAENYCSTCKEKLLSLDKCRSVFNYEKPINQLIKGAKYDGKKYLIELFVSYMATLYTKHFFNADYLTFVPMTIKAQKKRGYNQSEFLCRLLGEKVGAEVLDCLTKIKETDRQATLDKKGRLNNLQGVFRVSDRKSVKDKSIVIVDDVTTTGATAEVIAKLLKSAGAKHVYLLTVASVPPKDNY